MADEQKPLWEKVLEALGFNTTRLRWKLMQREERRRRAENAAENRKRALSYRHKACKGCGQIVDADARSCPHCKARLPGPIAARLGRVARLVVPEGDYTVTSVLVALNIAFYLAMMMRAHGGPSLHAFSTPISIPVMIRFGAIVPTALAHGEVWRLVTPVFLHGGLLHVLFNSLWLVSLGPLLEHIYGRSRFVVLYVLTGVIGFAASAVGHWGKPVVSLGASGAIFGLMGAAMIAGYVRRVPGTDELRGGNLAKWILLAVVLSFLPRIDWLAHFGGGAAGALMALGLASNSDARRVSDRLWLVAELLTLAVVVGAFVLALLTPAIR